MAEWDGVEELVHPSQQVVFVKNNDPVGSTPWRWPANGKIIEIKPGETKPIPRWAYDIGTKHAVHPLEILDPEVGSIEYEETKAAQLREKLKASEEAYAKDKAALDEAEEKAKAKRAEAKKGAGKKAASE